jgi:transposase
MAPAAEGLSASSDGLRLLSKLAVLGGMGPDTRQMRGMCGKHMGAIGSRALELSTQGFQVLQWRWIVERTFGWLNRSRRLSKDFEALPETTEAWIRIAMIQLMIRRLAAKK